MVERYTNREVIEKFINSLQDGIEGYGNVRLTDRSVLKTYSRTMAYWDTGKVVVEADLDGYSRTTSKHFHYLHSTIKNGKKPLNGVEIHTDGSCKDRWFDLANEVDYVSIVKENHE